MRDIIEMASEAGLFTHKEVQPELKRFAELVRADEREAYAKLCEEYSAVGKIEEFDRGWLACAKNIAGAIRARNSK